MSEPAPNIPGGELDRTRELKPGELDDALPTFSPPEALTAGSLAGQYVIKRLIGSGGGGMVYAAEHQVLKRPAAVKVLRRDKAALPSMVARFVREARAVNMIGHPNIVDIFEFGELPDGRPFYVMELLDGANLRKLLHLHGRFSPSEALDILEPVCAALDAAHKAGVVHRDLKASNISVLDDGNKRRVKLLDFGIAKLLQPEANGAGLTEAGSMLGTSHYMAPEQIRGEQVDERADIYALGVLLYQLLTGQYPYHSEQPEEIAWMHLTAPVPCPSALAPMMTPSRPAPSMSSCARATSRWRSTSRSWKRCRWLSMPPSRACATAATRSRSILPAPSWRFGRSPKGPTWPRRPPSSSSRATFVSRSKRRAAPIADCT